MSEDSQEAETQKAALLKIELMQTDDASNDDYMLRSKSEVLTILRSMLKYGTLITVHFNQGQDFLMTSLLNIAADGKSLVFDVGSNAEMNKRALASDKLICISNLEKVRIQFVLHGIDLIEYEGRPAFLADVPKALLRLQRRENFRLALPLLQRIKCIIPLKNSAGSMIHMEANILDISGGGIGIIAQSADVELEAGMLIPDCRIELPNVGTILTSLRVRSVFEVTSRNGVRSKRSGCQFIDLSGQMQILIQRYIIKMERERKAHEAGML
jgi:c-di-GMP-binding flagellar brake protein YcgR